MQQGDGLAEKLISFRWSTIGTTRESYNRDRKMIAQLHIWNDITSTVMFMFLQQ